MWRVKGDEQKDSKAPILMSIKKQSVSRDKSAVNIPRRRKYFLKLS